MKKYMMFVAALSFLFVSGCYDMTDIENVKSISAIGVSETTMTFCTVTTTPDEKIYGFDIYEFDTDNIYDGLNEISLTTGKEASISHLEAVIFEKDCPIEIYKSISSTVAAGIESHPKVMTAVSEISVKELFEDINIPSDTSLYKIISDVLNDKFASVTECNMLDLYYGTGFSKNAILPVIKLNDDGNIEHTGSACIKEDDILLLDKDITKTVNLLSNKNKPVFYELPFGDTAVNLTDINANFDKDRNFLSFNIDLVYNLTDADKDTEKKITDRIRSDIIKIINYKNTGYDVLNVYKYILKEFYTEKGLDEFVEKNGGRENFLKNINYNIDIGIKRGDF